MLTKTLQIAAICFSMANPSNIHIEQPKKANDALNFSLELPVTHVSSNTINNTQTYITQLDKKQTIKSNSYLNVLAYRYIQTDYDIINNEKYIEVTSTFNDNINKSSILYTLQITPYSNTINDRLNITLNTYLELSNITGVEATSINLNFTAYTSTETFWQNYIDVSYTTRNKNQDVIAAITNPQQGFMYTSDIYQQTKTLTNSRILTNQDININLDPNKTNFVFILMTITDPQAVNNWTTIKLTTGNSNIIEPSNRIGVLSGTFIPGIDNYEVIDIPGIMWEVLTMPFTFISIAFNLTIFPNTPYQVNLSNLFLSIIGIIIFAWILQKFIRKV